jgi:molecular chaperone GrpE
LTKPKNDPKLREDDVMTDAAAATTEAEDDGGRAPATDDTGAGDEVAALVKEKEALQDRLLRTAAEFDNYRKRIDRERREMAEYAAADLLTDVIAIVDDFERALQVPTDAQADAYRQGIELIHKQMLDLLRKRGVKPIEAVGTDFDPNFHQAVIHEVSAEHREGEVMQELRRGYMLGDRLLRPAMVKVAKA